MILYNHNNMLTEKNVLLFFGGGDDEVLDNIRNAKSLYFIPNMQSISLHIQVIYA